MDPLELAPHLAKLRYLEFVRLPNATADEAADWRHWLADRYEVLHGLPAS